MKQLSFLVIAAVLGSLITLSVYKMIGFDEKTVIIESASPATPAALTVGPAARMQLPPAPTNAPADFTYAAAKTMPAVVHIKATAEVVQRSRGAGGGGSQDDILEQFRWFFGDGQDPFGGGGQGGSPRGGAPRGSESAGSGVIISKDGYIVTNNHVIEGASKLEVTLFDKRSYSAELIGTDPSTDIALIKIDADQLATLQLADSDDAKVGEWVLAVGNPFNLSSTVTAGIVSAKGRNISILRDKGAIESFIQTDAAVNPGNSGGALVDVQGNLLGINTAIATLTGSYSGYSFAVPVNIAAKVVKDLKDFGTVQRAYLGIMIRDLNSELANELGTSRSQGVYVDNFSETSSALNSGMERGDVIIAVDGKTVNSSPELQELIGRKRPGDKVMITVDRNGKEKDFSVVLKNRMGNTNQVTAAAKESLEMNSNLGAEFRDLSKRELSELDIKGGVKINTLKEGKLSRADVREGFIITKVDDVSVSSAEELNNLLARKKGGVMLEGVYPNDSGVYYYAFGL